jgi:hypothetical protein
MEAVCETDDFCCRRQWDGSCVKTAMENLDRCTQDWPVQVNTCFEVDPFERPKCGDSVCQSIVCSLRPECCSDSYDEECVSLALRHCTLPEPENYCFQSSGVPGCTDDRCLDVVCEIDETCCTVAYSDSCVEIARQNAPSCPPPKITNTCFHESPFGGCTDRRCQELVCEISPGCCDDEVVGRWSGLCVNAARELCKPEIIPR